MNATKPDKYYGFGKVHTKRVLVIKNFNVSDNGLYICELYRHSVKWRAVDEKYVGIKGMYLESFALC